LIAPSIFPNFSLSMKGNAKNPTLSEHSQNLIKNWRNGHVIYRTHLDVEPQRIYVAMHLFPISISFCRTHNSEQQAKLRTTRMTKTNKIKDTTQKPKKMSTTEPTNNRGWTPMFVKGKQVLFFMRPLPLTIDFLILMEMLYNILDCPFDFP
jgi:hypothetical protein